MRLLRFCATVALLLAWFATPAMACLLPAQSLTPEESRCCCQMAGACHQGSAHHPCCKKIQPQDSAAIEARASLFPALAVTPAPAGQIDLLPAAPHRIAAAFYSPPHSPPIA